MRYDKNGHELPDDTPVAMPVNFRRPPSMQEMIAMYVRRELSKAADDAGHETFDEADDFDVPDDPPDPSSPWELDFDQIQAKPEPSHPGQDLDPAKPAAPPAGASSAPPGDSQKLSASRES